MSNSLDINPFNDSIEKLSSEYYGLDYEEEELEEDEDKPEQKPFDPEKIRVDQQMLSLKYIYELMTGELLNISPDFQRKRVWKDNKRKSLLIESLILRIPIPAFYFYENEDSKFLVIDGQQRLATIKDYLSDEFRLSGLEYLKDTCTGKRFSELDVKFQQRIYRTQMAVNILDARSPQKVIYDIFRRVNTGGMPLNAQEMRNAICSERVRIFLRKASQCNEFLEATRNRIKDERMDAQEMVIRFIAFYRAYDKVTKTIEYPYSNLVSMFDDQIDYLNKISDDEMNNYLFLFKSSMSRAHSLFGEFCFSKVYLDESEKVMRNIDVINKSLFSSFSVILADERFSNINLSNYSKDALYILAQSLQNVNYMNSVTIGTGDRRRINTNFYYSNEVINRCKIQ